MSVFLHGECLLLAESIKSEKSLLTSKADHRYNLAVCWGADCLR